MPEPMRGTAQLVDPLAASRHPFEVYLLALSAVSGVPLLFGEPNSGTIDAELPREVVAAWGAMLIAGSTLALVGLFWRGGRAASGLLMERTGLIGVGGASLVYAATALFSVGTDAAFSGCITAGFGAACFTQARRIGLRIRAVLAEMGSS